MSIAACLDSQTWRGTGVEGMATNQAQGKLSLDLNEARTDVTCHIDCLQLEQLCLFYTPSFLYLLLPSPRFSSPPLPVNLCTILSPVKDFSSSFTLFSFSSTYFLLTVEAWWQFITSNSFLLVTLPSLPTYPALCSASSFGVVRENFWLNYHLKLFKFFTKHTTRASSHKPQAASAAT